MDIALNKYFDYLILKLNVTKIREPVIVLKMLSKIR